MGGSKAEGWARLGLGPSEAGQVGVTAAVGGEDSTTLDVAMALDVVFFQ